MAGRPGLWACRPGRVLEGTLGWAARAGKGTTARRDTPLLLAGRYTCHWRNYSEVSLANGRIALFRYLLISHVPGQTDSAQAQAAHPSQVGKRPQTATEPAVPLTEGCPACCEQRPRGDLGSCQDARQPAARWLLQPDANHH
jgi:hypothetical protein